MAKPLFIVSAITGFYYFSLEQPLFGLGVFADHLLVCQPSPLTCASHDTKQRRLFCLFTCYATVWVLSLSSYHSWHAPSGPNSSFLWVVCHPSRMYPPKEPEQEPQNRFSPLPTARPCPLTSDPWPNHLLYWLGTSWWCLSLARASLLCISEICLLLTRPPWSRDLFAHLAAHPWFLMAWTIFWLLILQNLLLSGLGFCLAMGFSSFGPLPYSFLQSLCVLPYCSAIPTVVLFDPSLLDLFRLVAYSSLNDSV